MRFDVVTLFPEMIASALTLGVVGRALARGALRVRCKSPRDFGLGKHRSVDDTPYGGGAGMVMRVDCLVDCMEAFDAELPSEGAPGARALRVLLSPQGVRFDERLATELVRRPAVMLVCGRYEGFDERVRDYVELELSLGDFVLSGGELAALCVIDACARLLPGVLGNAASLAEESHSPTNDGRLEYPQYTRPLEFRGARVPDVLLSGHHADIAAWRRREADARTAAHRAALAPETLPGSGSSAPRVTHEDAGAVCAGGASDGGPPHDGAG